MKKSENAAYAKLRQDVAEERLERLYLFYGEETYLREHYKNRIFEIIGGQGMAEFNIVSLDGDGLTLDELTDGVESLPVMGEKKLIFVRDLNLSRPPAGVKEGLPELLGNLPDYLSFVLYCSSLEFKRDNRLPTLRMSLKPGFSV